MLEELDIIVEFIFKISDIKNIDSKFCLQCCRIWEYMAEYLNFKIIETLFWIKLIKLWGRVEIFICIISIAKVNNIKL